MSRATRERTRDQLDTSRKALDAATQIYYKYIEEAPVKKVTAMSLLNNLSSADKTKIFTKLEGLLGENIGNFREDYAHYTAALEASQQRGASIEEAEKIAIRAETERLKQAQSNGSASRSKPRQPFIDKDTYVETRERRDEAESKLGALLLDKVPARERDFEIAGQKQAGVTEGYAARRIQDGATHMVKVVPKKMSSHKQRRQQNRSDLVTEYIFGGLYERLLYDRAPKINLVEQDAANISITSKFFGNFQTLTELTGRSENGDINPYHPDLQRIEGFEKVIAASVFCGEADYHASNLGTVRSEDGKLTAVKIDHGRSAKTYLNEHDAREIFAYRFQMLGYDKMPFNITKFREHLEQMSNVSEYETEKIVGHRVHNLAQKGFNFSGVRAMADFRSSTPTFTKNAPEDVASYFSQDIVDRKNLMKEMASTISLIENLEPLKDTTINGGWVKEYADKNREQIIDYAIRTHKAIKPEYLKKMFLGETNNPETDQKLAIKYLAKKHHLQESKLTDLVAKSGFLVSDKEAKTKMTKDEKLIKFSIGIGKLTSTKSYLNVAQELFPENFEKHKRGQATYDFFMNNSTDSLVRVFLQAEKEPAKPEIRVAMEELFKSAPPDMRVKIMQVGEKLQNHSQSPQKTRIQRIKHAFSCWLNKSKDKAILAELKKNGYIQGMVEKDLRLRGSLENAPKRSHRPMLGANRGKAQTRGMAAW